MEKNQWAYCQLTVCKQFQTSAACRFIQFLNAVVVQQNVYRVVEPSLRNRWLLIHQSDWSDATLKLDVVWQPYFFFHFHVHISLFDLGLEEPFSHFQDFFLLKGRALACQWYSLEGKRLSWSSGSKWSQNTSRSWSLLIWGLCFDLQVLCYAQSCLKKVIPSDGSSLNRDSVFEGITEYLLIKLQLNNFGSLELQ